MNAQFYATLLKKRVTGGPDVRRRGASLLSDPEEGQKGVKNPEEALCMSLFYFYLKKHF